MTVDDVITEQNAGLTLAERARVEVMTAHLTPQLVEVIQGLSQTGATVRQVAEVIAGLLARMVVKMD
jgi:hypothetical protein